MPCRQESEVVGLLERQIAVADCQVCAAVINFLQQVCPGNGASRPDLT